MRPIRFVSFWLCALVAPVFAGTAWADATVSGTVTDGAGFALVGAEVGIAGTGLSTATGAEGDFRLGAVPSGKQMLIVEYLGYVASETAVEVPDSGVVRLDAVVLDQLDFGDVIEVRGEPILQGQARALNQQKSAVAITNVVAADQIGRFPDPNVAEATQRIPGITLQRDQGEGRFVIVRGTEPRLNSMTINGDRIPSPEGGVRNVPLDVIPADLLDAIEVTKALTPDMDADAIGGTVNLVTKRAPAQRRLSANLAAGQNDITGDGLWIAGIAWGQRFDDDRLGVLLSGSGFETDRGSDNFEVEYDDGFLDTFELRDYTITRERYGATGDFDYQINDSSDVYIRGIYNEFADQEFRRAKVDKVADNEIERELKDRYEEQQIHSVSAGGSTLLGKAVLEYRVSYSYAEEAELDRLDTVFKQEDVEFAPNVTDTSIDPDDIRSEPLNEDVGAFVFDGGVFEDSLTTEEDVVFAADVLVPFFRDAAFAGAWKFGAKARFKEKDQDIEVFEVELDDLMLTDVIGGFDRDGFLDDRYDIGPFQDPGEMRRRLNGLEREKDIEEDLGDYDASEDTTALYGQVELLLGDNLTFLGGARWERTEFDYRANELVFDDDGDIVAVNPTSGSSENDEILPSAHLRWALDEETNVRFAVTRSLARPNYEDLAPFSLILEEDGEIQRGNPNLDITTAWNYDIMWERYLSTVGIVSAGVFYKQIEDNIFFFTAEEDRNGDTFDVIQPRNGDSAEVIGLEVAYQNRFRNLPAPWDGLGLYFNATFIDSEAAIPERDDTLFPGQADTVYNLSLSYEKYGFSGRVSLNYHSEYLSEVGGDEASDIFIDERTQLDLSFSQQVTSKVRLYLDVLNLTDEPFRVYEGSEDRPIQEEYYSWWGTFGVKIDL